jgi:hypothetical protein
MPLTTKEVVKAQHAINSLIEQDKENKFIFPSAIRIKQAGNLRRTRPVVEDYLKEHETLVRRLGKASESGNITVTPENVEEFNRENNAMLAEPTDVVLTPMTEKDLGENQLSIDLIATLQEVGLLA